MRRQSPAWVRCRPRNAPAAATSHAGRIRHSNSGMRDQVPSPAAATATAAITASVDQTTRRTIGFDHRSAGVTGCSATGGTLLAVASSSTGMAREGSGWDGAAPALTAMTGAASSLGP